MKGESYVEHFDWKCDNKSSGLGDTDIQRHKVSEGVVDETREEAQVKDITKAKTRREFAWCDKLC